jgi:hypothetical protein
VRPLVHFQHILHAGYEGGVGLRRDDPLLLEVRPENVFLASARSCCRWHGQQCSAPRPPIPAASMSTARGPWVDRNKPVRSAWPRLLRRRCAVWPRLANACGSGPPRTPLPPVAGGSLRSWRRWFPGPRRSGCHSILRQPPKVSAFSRMLAFANWRARRLPVWINVLSGSRSSPLSFTTYFFTEACFAVTMHLRCRDLSTLPRASLEGHLAFWSSFTDAGRPSELIRSQAIGHSQHSLLQPIS